MDCLSLRDGVLHAQENENCTVSAQFYIQSVLRINTIWAGPPSSVTLKFRANIKKRSLLRHLCKPDVWKYISVPIDEMVDNTFDDAMLNNWKEKMYSSGQES